MKKKIIIFAPVAMLLLIWLLGLDGEELKISLTLAMSFWMVSWWIAEIMPLGITAMIPLVFLPVSGLSTLKAIAPSYANPVIYLFLGGFILARALSKTGLDKRMALTILKYFGRSDSGIVIGFVIATSFLSMWISNTATTVMMVPIALSVLKFLEESLESKDRRTLDSLSIVLFLSIAYSANIGGTMTPVGTPPNVVFIGYLDELYSIQIDFWRWTAITAPIAITVLIVQSVLLKKIFPYQVPINEGFAEYIRSEIKKLGPLQQKQKLTLFVFTLVCGFWIFKGLIHYAVGFKFLQDASIAIFGGLLLFLAPMDRDWKKPILDQHDISLLPWNIVLLFGGGIALAGALKDAQLIQLTTDYIVSYNIGSEYILVFILAGIVLFLTEMMSNVALCVVALPVIMSLGNANEISPFLIGLPATLCASFAFSMPISTPPNAIVFATERVKIKHMLMVGIPLNFIGWFTVMSIGWVLLKYLG